MSLKNKIDGNELDLSLNQLEEVPVKELAAATRATNLDLSCNLIQYLPNDFASLRHLVKIDLSKNKLKELPDNFGDLIYLVHLDLYANQIITLPLSFCRLKKLRWLDIKNNPLDPEIKKITGDCLDSKECQACAKSVVHFMQSVEISLKQDKQKRLKEEQEKEELQRAQAEKELEGKRKMKKAEKEKRKAEMKVKKLKESPVQNVKEKKIEHKVVEKPAAEKKKKTKKSVVKKGGSRCSTFLMLFFAILAAAVGVLGFIFSQRHSFSDISVEVLQVFGKEMYVELRDTTAVWWNVFFIPYATSIKSTVLQCINSSMVHVTEFINNLDFSSLK